MNASLITASALSARLNDREARTLVCDCSFDLADPNAGARAHAAGHIPNAVYLHLDQDLSGIKTGRNGRHPLPDRAAFAARMAELGASDESLIVAYDASGAMFAGRLWWMLRWAGHAQVAVLDGGLAAWRAAGGAVQVGISTTPVPGHFTLRPALTRLLTYTEVRSGLGQGRRLLVDARAADRFQGQNETIDPVAGHIPGAANRPFRDNLGPDGRFKTADELRRDWQALMAGREPAELVQYCGSGATACHNLLAMDIAGLPGAALYAGSWSEWCAQPEAPIALG